MREAKASIVHGYHPARFEIKKSASRIGGIGVNVAKLRRVVSADGQQRQLRRKAFANLAEASEISRISRVIHRVLPRLQTLPRRSRDAHLSRFARPSGATAHA